MVKVYHFWTGLTRRCCAIGGAAATVHPRHSHAAGAVRTAYSTVHPAPFAKAHSVRFPAASQLTLLIDWRSLRQPGWKKLHASMRFPVRG